MNIQNKLSFHIVTNGVQVKVMSGGTRIFIEIAQRLASLGHTVKVYTTKPSQKDLQGHGLKGVHFVLWPFWHRELDHEVITFLVRPIMGCLSAWQTHLPRGVKETIIYSAADFPSDSLPAFAIKLKNPDALWVAGFYLFAPNPFKGFRNTSKPGWRLPKVRELLYYVSQRPIYWLIKWFADMIFVTSKPDKQRFVRAGRNPKEIVVVRGGVDISEANRYLNSGDKSRKHYEACFVGRFHPQKGVIELIDIWSRVCAARPGDRLAMIGVGALEDEVRRAIHALGLEENIVLLGYKDGQEKHEVFKASWMILHPAVYDSGGMAACEGMAWGLPAVGFDLEAHKTYYAQGMLKAPLGDLDAFAELIIRLLEDHDLYESVRTEAIEWANGWDWDQRTMEILNRLSAIVVTQ